jgi:release factor glutamine methyltransferase
MNLQSCWRLGTVQLTKIAGGAARLETDLLLAHLLEIDRTGLYMLSPWTELPDPLTDAFALLLQRRVAGEPVAYLLGEKDFMGLALTVGPGVLIPRPETELLVETLTDFLREMAPEQPKTLLDLCCGSGAIGIAVARQLELAALVLSDCSDVAMEYARANARRYLAGAEVEFALGDFLEPHLKSGRRFTAIACNPPYIPAADIPGLMVDVRDFEPHLALDGGADGLDFFRRLAEQAPALLYSGAMLAVEIGWDQGAAVAALFAGSGFKDVRIVPDMAGKDRVVSAVR